MKNNKLLKELLYVIMLSAISIVLSLFEIPWIVVFLKFDLSEIMILIALMTVGFRNTSFVILLRTVGRRMVHGFEPIDLFGELMAIITSFLIIGAYYLVKLILRKQPEKRIKNDVILVVTTTLLVSTIMTFINFFFSTPIFLTLTSDKIHFTFYSFANDPQYQYFFESFGVGIKGFFIFSIATYLPFNVIKMLVVSILFVLIRPRLKMLTNM